MDTEKCLDGIMGDGGGVKSDQHHSVINNFLCRDFEELLVNFM